MLLNVRFKKHSSASFDFMKPFHPTCGPVSLLALLATALRAACTVALARAPPPKPARIHRGSILSCTHSSWEKRERTNFHVWLSPLPLPSRPLKPPPPPQTSIDVGYCVKAGRMRYMLVVRRYNKGVSASWLDPRY